MFFVPLAVFSFQRLSASALGRGPVTSIQPSNMSHRRTMKRGSGLRVATRVVAGSEGLFSDILFVLRLRVLFGSTRRCI